MITEIKMRIAPRLRTAVRAIVDSKYRRQNLEARRLRSLPRYQPTETTLLGAPLRIVDAASYLSAYRQIFENHVYDFAAKNDAPRILDGGANVGLSVLYFKERYPHAFITAFEADPEVFEVLQWNCMERGLKDIELVHTALWGSNGEVDFQTEGADAGHVVEGSGHVAGRARKVPATRLRDFLGRPVDLLKLDIEGAEVEVLLDCADLLENVEHLFVEYHSYVGKPQRLHEILNVLQNAHFRFHLQPELVSPRPFIRRLDSIGMDQRLNIFAYR